MQCTGLPYSHAARMTITEFNELLDEMGPMLKVMTISPSAEAKFGHQRLRAVLQRGVTPCIYNLLSSFLNSNILFSIWT